MSSGLLLYLLQRITFQGFSTSGFSQITSARDACRNACARHEDSGRTDRNEIHLIGRTFKFGAMAVEQLLFGEERGIREKLSIIPTLSNLS